MSLAHFWYVWETQVALSGEVPKNRVQTWRNSPGTVKHKWHMSCTIRSISVYFDFVNYALLFTHDQLFSLIKCPILFPCKMVIDITHDETSITVTAEITKYSCNILMILLHTFAFSKRAAVFFPLVYWLSFGAIFIALLLQKGKLHLEQQDEHSECKLVGNYIRYSKQGNSYRRLLYFAPHPFIPSASEHYWIFPCKSSFRMSTHNGTT